MTWRPTTNEDFFPKLNGGFWADLEISNGRLRLLAHIHETKWAASVFNRSTKEWISKLQIAKSAKEAQKKAELIARKLLPGDYEIDWKSVR